jgi:hypothetical protein
MAAPIAADPDEILGNVNDGGFDLAFYCPGMQQHHRRRLTKQWCVDADSAFSTCSGSSGWALRWNP